MKNSISLLKIIVYNIYFVVLLLFHSTYRIDDSNFLRCQTVYVCDSHLQHLCLGAEALGAQLHDRVGAESVSDLVLTERAQPQRQRTLQLQRRDKDGLVT